MPHKRSMSHSKFKQGMQGNRYSNQRIIPNKEGHEETYSAKYYTTRKELLRLVHSNSLSEDSLAGILRDYNFVLSQLSMNGSLFDSYQKATTRDLANVNSNLWRQIRENEKARVHMLESGGKYLESFLKERLYPENWFPVIEEEIKASPKQFKQPALPLEVMVYGIAASQIKKALKLEPLEDWLCLEEIRTIYGLSSKSHVRKIIARSDKDFEKVTFNRFTFYHRTADLDQLLSFTPLKKPKHVKLTADQIREKYNLSLEYICKTAEEMTYESQRYNSPAALLKAMRREMKKRRLKVNKIRRDGMFFYMMPRQIYESLMFPLKPAKPKEAKEYTPKFQQKIDEVRKELGLSTKEWQSLRDIENNYEYGSYTDALDRLRNYRIELEKSTKGKVILYHITPQAHEILSRKGEYIIEAAIKAKADN